MFAVVVALLVKREQLLMFYDREMVTNKNGSHALDEGLRSIW